MTFDTKEKVAQAVLAHIRYRELNLENLAKSTIPYEDLNASTQAGLREIGEVVETILKESKQFKVEKSPDETYEDFVHRAIAVGFRIAVSN